MATLPIGYPYTVPIGSVFNSVLAAPPTTYDVNWYDGSGGTPLVVQATDIVGVLGAQSLALLATLNQPLPPVRLGPGGG